MVPHKGQMARVRKLADVFCAREFGLTCALPEGLETLEVHHGDYAASMIQLAVETVLHDHHLDPYGKTPDDAADLKLSGDAGKLSSHIMCTFCAVIMTDARKRDPVTGRTSRFVQSTDELFVLGCILRNETGLLWHEIFKMIMLWFKGVQQRGAVICR
jgi:hypothetical protein